MASKGYIMPSDRRRRASVPSAATAPRLRLASVFTTLALFPLMRQTSAFSAGGYAMGREWRMECRRHPSRQIGGSWSTRVHRRATTHGPRRIIDGSSSKFTIPQPPTVVASGISVTETPPKISTATTNAVDSAPGNATATPSGFQRLRVAMFFFFWYAFNVGYNLSTKFT